MAGLAGFWKSARYSQTVSIRPGWPTDIALACSQPFVLVLFCPARPVCMNGNWPVNPYLDPRTGLLVQYAYPASGNLVHTFHAPPHPPVIQVYSLPPPNPYAYAYPPWPPQIRIDPPPRPPHFAVAAPRPLAPSAVSNLQTPARQQPSPSLSVSPSPTVGSTSSSRPSSTASVVVPRYEAPAPRQDSPPCEAQLRDQRNYKPPAPGMSSDSAVSPALLLSSAIRADVVRLESADVRRGDPRPPVHDGRPAQERDSKHQQHAVHKHAPHRQEERPRKSVVRGDEPHLAKLTRRTRSTSRCSTSSSPSTPARTRPASTRASA